ncbi:DEAD/DEAH box helicase family protein [Sunxiuqinia sp. sy24]|uniref:DEAD/DEAH box helicase family protein n=1 Tax=Sunxiuqinia sp. sy24 TaxID=3461495 RepID=UPI00404592B1
MLSQIGYPQTLEYSSDGLHLPIEFFMLTIPHCKHIDLKLGYFSSNAIRTLSYGFAQFIHNGGTLRIITNHFLSYQDKMLLDEANSELAVEESEMKRFVEDDLESLAKILESGDQHFFDCLKYLLRSKRLEIIPVKLRPNKLAHFKQGVLDDGTSQVYFNGSCNFTYKGLIDNGESIAIARSWGERSEKLKLQENISSIDRICKKEDPGFEYLHSNQIIEIINRTGQDRQLNELIETELEVFEKLSKLPRLKKVLQAYISNFREVVKKEKQRIHFPYPEGPRDYQQQAYEKWKANKYQGIFAMATGTGKTITALNCLLEIYQNSNNYRAVILVPTISLVRQWKEEAFSFNMRNVITASSKDKWESQISTVLLGCKIKKNQSFVIIVTYASFHRPKFQNYFKKLPKDTCLIADEAHNMGSPKILATLKDLSVSKRIGLSATPERIYDNWGNKQIRSFFNDGPPYIVNYSMELAIKKKVLCQYFYYPHIVYLNEIELNEYLKISKKLIPFFDSNTGTYKDDPIVEILLLKRKRIIHKAQSKIEAFGKMTLERYNEKGNLKYSLVYVPEGIEPNYDESDLHDDNAEDSKLIDQYTKVVSAISPEVTISQFTGETKNRNEILNNFSSGKIHVLSSMKCLDEGVDIPRTELAFFCSSTGNPRQFIQRRGRILRKHPEKDFAVIHDLVVVPKLYNNSDISYDMERNMVVKEFERVVNFSFLAINKYHTFEALENVLKHYGISLFEIEENLKSR